MKFSFRNSQFIKIALLAVSVLILQSCSMGAELLKEVNSLNSVKNDEVIIVGTIELIPRLVKDEQELDPPSGVIALGDYASLNRNRALIQFNNQPEASDYKYLINPELGKTFFFKVSRDMKYMVEGNVLMEFGGLYGDTGKIVLPTWFKVDIKPNDRAVYIGKIKYKRDDFNSITELKLIDDYSNALKQFRKKFGKKYTLRKSLIKKI